MLGYFDLGLGTLAVEGALGAGGGRAGMFRPILPGATTGMVLKS